MTTRTTRATKDLKQVNIESLSLSMEKEKKKEATQTEGDNIMTDFNLLHSPINMNEESNEETKSMAGHDVDDQGLTLREQQHSPTTKKRYSIRKFDGSGDAEQWLKHVMEQFDLGELSEWERNKVVPEILTSDAKIWYVKYHEKMPTFFDFMKQFIHRFGNDEPSQKSPSTVSSMEDRTIGIEDLELNESAIENIQIKMLSRSLEKLPKFTGKSKQNVSKWLKEFEQTMQSIKLSDYRKLFFASQCLEAEARDWYYDNRKAFGSWEMFTRKLLKTFESSSKADIAFNRLRHYEQGIHQDVQQYYFEILRLCHDTNASMDAGTKLQYLKDGLKPSLRFDVLLNDPKTPEQFLEYAKKVEELKSLDERQMNADFMPERKFNIPARTDRTTPDINRQQNTSTNDTVASGREGDWGRKNDIKPKPPYQCYKCGDPNHLMRNCPNFQ